MRLPYRCCYVSAAGNVHGTVRAGVEDPLLGRAVAGSVRDQTLWIGSNRRKCKTGVSEFMYGSGLITALGAHSLG
jgi:hypothetical protein